MSACGSFRARSPTGLVNAQKGRTKAKWRFKNEDEINDELLGAYVKEAIENQRQGREIKADRNKLLEIHESLAAALAANKKAGKRLSPGKRREYAEYIAEARREDTRNKRLEKIMPMILAGHGLNDWYRR